MYTILIYIYIILYNLKNQTISWLREVKNPSKIYMTKIAK